MEGGRGGGVVLCDMDIVCLLDGGGGGGGGGGTHGRTGLLLRFPYPFPFFRLPVYIISSFFLSFPFPVPHPLLPLLFSAKLPCVLLAFVYQMELLNLI